MHMLVVIDMQNDFIHGALGTAEAVAILPHVVQRIQTFQGQVIATRDTHGPNYLDTAEGRALPIPHCIQGTDGWQLHPDIAALISAPPIDKPTFGSLDLVQHLIAQHQIVPIRSITLVGLCTDICVISNAMLIKAALPEVPVLVDPSCCAGVSPASHTRALEAMAACQVQIL